MRQTADCSCQGANVIVDLYRSRSRFVRLAAQSARLPCKTPRLNGLQRGRYTAAGGETPKVYDPPHRDRPRVYLKPTAAGRCWLRFQRNREERRATSHNGTRCSGTSVLEGQLQRPPCARARVLVCVSTGGDGQAGAQAGGWLPRAAA
jgi:hypothetical protein